MDNKQFYVRMRGRVTGPFGLEQLKSLRDRGQFRRFHEISGDKKTWVPASTIIELFPETDNRSGKLREAPMAAPATTPVLQLAPAEPATSTPAPQWFYIDAEGNEKGPLTRDHLLDLWQSGSILHNTLVWKEGMPDWLEISSTVLGLPLQGVSTRAYGDTRQPEILQPVGSESLRALRKFLLDPVGGLPGLCDTLGGVAALGLGLIFCVVIYLCLLLGFVFTMFGIGNGLVPKFDGPREILRFDNPRPPVEGRAGFAFTNNDLKKDFGRYMVIVALSALIPFVCLALAITIIRTVTGGIGRESGGIGFDFLISGAALLPIGLLSPVVPLLGLGNLEAILFLYLVTLCLTILILNSAFTRVIKLSDRGSILAIPCSLALTLWLSKVVIVLSCPASSSLPKPFFPGML
jgi:hypothetical protein